MLEKLERIEQQWRADLKNESKFSSAKYRKACEKDLARLQKKLAKVYTMYLQIEEEEKKIEGWLDTII